MNLSSNVRISAFRSTTFALIECAIVFSLLPAQQKEVIGYYPSWKWRDTASLMTIDKIPYRKLTIIDYAFWHPLPNGSLAGINPKGDDLCLGRQGKRRNLVDLAHEKNVKVMLSIGGWEDSDNFPAVAARDTLRAAFAHACVMAIRKFEFDGIDIDWEFPGFTDHKGGPDDRHNYTLLLQTLRDSLKANEIFLKKKLLLTAALPAGAKELANFEFQHVAELLDMLNIMTYDYNGPWSPVSGHNSPLYASGGDDTLLNIDATFKMYNEQLHVPPSKINLGIAFYGHSFAQCTALHTPYKGSDTTLFPEGDVFYYNIFNTANKVRHWDDKAKVPYFVLPEASTLVSCDDEESIGLKAKYVLDHKVGGVIIWEITGDYLRDGTTPLLDAATAVFSAIKSSK